MKEAGEALTDKHRISVLHFSEIFPFPAAETSTHYLEILRHAKKTFCLEQNATGQFAKLLRAETGHEFTGMINRFDGRPFTVEALVEEINARI
jgi:2-oxoglutarate ferredoxin oxidoreductase subunit alpha